MIAALDFAQRLELAASRINDDVAEILQEGIEPIRENIRANFDQAQAASGQSWPPHAPATVARYGPHPLLILTGRLRAAATGDGPSAEHVEQVEGDALVFGVRGVPYAAFHQYGTEHIPVREYMAVSDETVDILAQQVAAAVMQRLTQ